MESKSWRILYVADTASWHNSLWIKFFVRDNKCVIFSDFKAGFNPVTFPAQLKIHEIPPVIELGNRHLNKISSMPYYLYLLGRLVLNFKPDVIHAVAMYYGFQGALISKLTAVPLIYTLQGSEVLVKANKSAVYRFMLRVIFKQASAVTADSQTLLNAAKVLGLDKNKCHHIQNGVPLSVFKVAELGANDLEFKKQYSLRKQYN